MCIQLGWERENTAQNLIQYYSSSNKLPSVCWIRVLSGQPLTLAVTPAMVPSFFYTHTHSRPVVSSSQYLGESLGTQLRRSDVLVSVRWGWLLRVSDTSVKRQHTVTRYIPDQYQIYTRSIYTIYIYIHTYIYTHQIYRQHIYTRSIPDIYEVNTVLIPEIS